MDKPSLTLRPSSTVTHGVKSKPKTSRPPAPKGQGTRRDKIMLNADEARKNTKRDIYLEGIEEQIREASLQQDSYIVITVLRIHQPSFDKVQDILLEHGYKVEMTGIAGHSSVYYRISW